MAESQRGIIGIGYEGISQEALTDQILGWGVETLVDVRLNAISRKTGFSKKGLQAYLHSRGVQYLHMPELGNARDNRAGFSEPGTVEGDAARRKYRDSLESHAAIRRLDELAELAATGRVAVLCFESRETECHRHEVLRAVHDRLDSLVH